MKKTITALLCALIIALSLSPAFAAEGERYIVSAARANILPEADITLQPVGEVPGGTYVYVTQTKGDFMYISVRSSGISGWVHSSLLTYAEKTGEAADGIKSIYVKTMPDKTQYIEDEDEFISDGLEVYAKYSDGRADEAIKGYRLFAPAFDSVGEKTVYVVYKSPSGASFSTSFTVTANRVPLKNISISSPPDKTVYIERQTLDLSGIRLRAEYTDGREDRYFTSDDLLSDKDFTVVSCHGETDGAPLEQGTHKIDISYKYDDIICSFEISVKEKSIVSLTVKTPPDSNVVYSKTEMPALKGLTLTAGYDNGETETVTPDMCEISCEPEKFVLGSGNTATLTYKGQSVDIDLKYALEEPVEIRVVPPEILAFVLGEDVDLSGTKVYVVYNSGRREETSDFTMSEVDNTRTGPQTVTVTCGEFSNTFTIYVQEFYRRGDVTGDGKITAYDARLVLRAAVGYINYKGRIFSAADADRDGKISAYDARLVLRAAVGLEDL